MGDNRTAFSMGDSAHLKPPICPPSFYSKLSPKPIVKNNSSRNFARMPSYSTLLVKALLDGSEQDTKDLHSLGGLQSGKLLDKD